MFENEYLIVKKKKIIWINLYANTVGPVYNIKGESWSPHSTYHSTQSMFQT